MTRSTPKAERPGKWLLVSFVRVLGAVLAIPERVVALSVSLNRLDGWCQDYNFRLRILHRFSSFRLRVAAS